MNDVWIELERVGAVEPPPSDLIVSVRTEVRRAITTAQLRQRVLRRRRRRMMWSAVLGVGAAVAVGILSVDVGGHRVGGEQAAAAVLARAARVELAATAPRPGPGQFLQTTKVQRSWSAWNDDGMNPVYGRDGEVIAAQEELTITTWLPANSDQPVVRTWSTRVLRTSSSDPRTGQLVRTDSSAPKIVHVGLAEDPAWYRGLPRSVDPLMRRVARDLGGENRAFAALFSEAYSEVLRSGVAPPDVRAVLFRGLADEPGVEVDRSVQFEGVKGVSIGVGRQQLVFDDASGAYLGERVVDPDFPRVEGLDADGTTLSTVVTTRVVDSAPAASE